jgi:probable rRNA maturation factor
VFLNRQADVRVDLRDARRFARRLHSVLGLRRRKFNVCFVSDQEIAALNKTYRGKRKATDVLSFPWQGRRGSRTSVPGGEFAEFLGEVVISVPTAQRNARTAGHSMRTEIRWLILHGVLHLLGHDHETDGGEMTSMELALRDLLDRDGRRGSRRGPHGPKLRSGSASDSTTGHGRAHST